MGKGARNGSAFGLETGLVRPAEIVRLEPLAVSGRTLCELLGHKYSTMTLRRLTERGLPKPLEGGDARWILSEVRAWLASAPRQTIWKKPDVGAVLDSGAGAQ